MTLSPSPSLTKRRPALLTMIAPALCGNSSRGAVPGAAGSPGKSAAAAPNVPSTYPMSNSWAPQAMAISRPSPVLPSPPIATASAQCGAKVRSSRGLWVKPPRGQDHAAARGDPQPAGRPACADSGYLPVVHDEALRRCAGQYLAAAGRGQAVDQPRGQRLWAGGVQAGDADVAVGRHEREILAEAGQPVVGGELVVDVDVDGGGVVTALPGGQDRLTERLSAVRHSGLLLQAGAGEQQAAARADRRPARRLALLQQAGGWRRARRRPARRRCPPGRPRQRPHPH